MVAEMPRSPLADAFGHHVWATTRLIDACMALTNEQLQATVPGTYGSIIDTFAHLAASDRGYLSVLSNGRLPRVDDEVLDLDRSRRVMEENRPEWSRVIAELDDPDEITVRTRPDGSGNRAPAGIRLAQALHHGTDHRSQIATILTMLGIGPPDIDVWEFAALDGRIEDFSASS